MSDGFRNQLHRLGVLEDPAVTDLEYVLASVILSGEPFTLNTLADPALLPSTADGWDGEERQRVTARRLLRAAASAGHIVANGKVGARKGSSSSPILTLYVPTRDGLRWAGHVHEQVELPL